MGILSMVEAVVFVLLSIKQESFIMHGAFNSIVVKLCSYGQLFAILSILNFVCIYTKYKNLRGIRLSLSVYTVIFYILSAVAIMALL